MVAKRLAGKHVANVQLQQRHACALDGIHQRNAGVRIGTGVQNHPGQCALGVQATGFVNPVQQLPLMVALVKAQRQAVARAGHLAQLLHIGQGVRPIDLRLTRAQQVEIGAIEHKNRLAHRRHRCFFLVAKAADYPASIPGVCPVPPAAALQSAAI